MLACTYAGVAVAAAILAVVYREDTQVGFDECARTMRAYKWECAEVKRQETGSVDTPTLQRYDKSCERQQRRRMVGRGAVVEVTIPSYLERCSERRVVGQEMAVRRTATRDR